MSSTLRFSATLYAALASLTVPLTAAAEHAGAPSATQTEAVATLPEVTLEGILRVALERSPDLLEAKARSQAAKQLAPVAARLPEPELEYQLWAQPLARPLSVDEAQMHMVGLRQAFPAPGTLGSRSEAASAKAQIVEQSYQARRLDLVANVRRAYAAYYLADREYQLHLEHAGLMRKVVELAQAAYQAGSGTQQDVLRADLELSRLHNDVAAIRADREAGRGLLNTLMGRAAGSPLGPPAALARDAGPSSLPRSPRGSSERRPEILAARSAIRAGESELSASRAASRWPSFMVGVQYMYMPMMADAHNYGLMFSMNLPWLSARYSEETRSAQANVAAERSALRSAQLAAEYQLHQASHRLEAARTSLGRIETELLPQAQRSFEATQASYRGGQLDSMALIDALQVLLQVRTERERGRVNLALAAAELERATGDAESHHHRGVPAK